jgi:hypothetical protein
MGGLTEFEGHRSKDGVSMIHANVAGCDNILLPLSQHGLITLQGLGRMGGGGCSSSTLRASPFCHESPLNQREIKGWVLDTPSASPASALPLPYNLFHGITVALCETSESEVLNLMQNIEATRIELSQAVDEIMKPVKEEAEMAGICENSKRASWARCKPASHSGFPTSLQYAYRNKEGDVVFEQDSGKNTPIIDSEDWIPELSPDGYIGFFHHWHHGTRESKLCLYVVCQSYLPKACMEFADVVHRAGELCTAGCVCLSEELQWLKNACVRNRTRLIADVCSKMNIRVPTMTDYNSPSASGTKIAIITTDTLHHDLVLLGDNVRLLNHCSETRSAFNGSACSMAPWEGVWIFQGLNSTHSALQSSMMSGVSDFGKPYGDHILPTSSPRVLDRSALSGPNMPLTFVSADPLQCKPLQIWNQEQASLIIVSEKQIAHIVSPSTCSIEGLDPDVVIAFQKYLSMRSCPTAYAVPNIPGALPPSMAHNYLVFDEHVLKSMSKLGWSRSQGIVKLTPMACALYEHWKTQGAACYDAH